MKITNFSKGIVSSSLGSFWWGVFGTYYFQYISFIGTLEVVVHRSMWTCLILIITTTFLKKWNIFKKIISDRRKISILTITSILIFANWSIWIYAVSTNRIIDASFGYFIFPIISVFFGYLFLNEKLNKKRIFSISLVIFSTSMSIYLNSNPSTVLVSFSQSSTALTQKPQPLRPNIATNILIPYSRL